MKTPKHYLTKTDFRIAQDCPAKLYYTKTGYPSKLEGNEYMAYLADGGFMVEKLAQLLFPQGEHTEFPPSDIDGAWAFTQDWIAKTDQGVLFEAVIISEPFMVRVDILEKQGRVLILNEVKSISGDKSEGGNPFRGKQGGISSKRRPYVEDICFQVLTAEKAFPDLEVSGKIVLVDKSRPVGPECIQENFKIINTPEEMRTGRPRVEFTGDLTALRENHPLWFVDMREEIEELRGEISQNAARIAQSLMGQAPEKIPGSLSPKCGKCEFRFYPAAELEENDQLRDGFRECWGRRAYADPHILDLTQCSRFPNMAERCAIGDTNLVNLDPAQGAGKYGERQAIQIEYSRKIEEFLDEDLPRTLAGHPYPLHFIDFETTRTALPYHAGMRPYELITFQWSCHTLREPDGRLEHQEWISTEKAFPNFEFAKSLQKCIGGEGTVYIWSQHENTCMREIARQLDESNTPDPALSRWLNCFEEGKDSRIIDLCDMAKRHYFHPKMKGSCSIKAVLPAIWQSFHVLKDDPDFSEYRQAGSKGAIDNPYKSLPALTLSDGSVLSAIDEGTGAIRAYEDILFGLASQDEERKILTRDLLLQYCKLDTAAMVMIWKRWMQHHAPKN